MFNNIELIQQLEVDVVAAKRVSLMGKAKAVEKCVDSLVAVIKAQESANNKLMIMLVEVRKELMTHRKTGK
jgi:U3 small nucleolar ribonucleoprotein component